MLGVEESNARLLDKVTQQEEGLSVLENTRLNMYLFCIWLMPWFFLSFASELVVLFLELGRKIGSLEQELETAKATIGRSTEALAKSLKEQHALKEELDQICNITQVVISEVFGSGPSTSTPAVQLPEVPNEVRALISDGMFYKMSGVLTLVVMHHLNLDFVAIYRGYIDRWSADAIHALGESLVPCAQMVAEQVFV